MEGQIKCFSDKVKLKEFIITKTLLYEMLKGIIQEKEDQTINSEMTTNHNYQQLNLKTKNNLSKQLEQEQNHRNGDHMEGYQ